MLISVAIYFNTDCKKYILEYTMLRKVSGKDMRMKRDSKPRGKKNHHRN